MLLIHGALPPPADEEEKTLDETKISHVSGPPLAMRKNSTRSRNRVSHGRSRTAKFRCETLGRILTLAIADRDAIVRKTAIAALKPPFDRDLAQVNMLRRLFVALNDEDFEIRDGYRYCGASYAAQPGIHYAIASQNVSAVINRIRILKQHTGSRRK